MRTKALLGLAVLAASAATCVAQNVYSLNIVGYVNAPVEANKFYLLENPLTQKNSGGNAITNLIKLDNTFDSSTVYTFSAGKLSPVETFVADVGWFPGTTVLAPGTGFYLYPSAAGTITFVGEVVTAATNALAVGYNLVGSPFPASTNLVALGLQGKDSDTIYRWDNTGAKGKFNLITYVQDLGWFDDAVVGGGPTDGPALKVGEGFYYYNANTAQDWKQSFTVQ